MNLYSFSTLVFSSGVLLIAVLALVKRKDKIAIRFLLFSICIFGWGFLFSFWITQNYSEIDTLKLARLAAVFVVFIPITWFHFVLTFIGKKEPFPYFYLINYTIAFFFVAIAPTPLIFEGVHPILGFKFMPTPGALHHFHLAIFVVLVPYGFYHLIRAYLFESGTRKDQLKYLLAGSVSGFVAGSSIYLAFYNIPFPLLLLIVMPLYPILTGIALIRYGLFDVQQIVDAFRRDKLAAIGTLATSINHEIRNPLYVVRGLAEAYLANVDDKIFKSDKEEIAKAREIFKKTSEHAARAMEIMKKFAVFAKDGAKQQPLLEPQSFRDIFERILPLIRHELELDKIELVNSIPDNLPLLRADRCHLEEILFNLIVNACQAMKEKGGGWIEVSAGQKNGSIEVKIQDNGPGIETERLLKIFEPFYTTKQEGTGLGLYITKQLVEKNEGKIEVDSKIGAGTVFILRFKRN